MNNVVFLVALGVGGAFGYAVGRFQAARQKEQTPGAVTAPVSVGEPIKDSPYCDYDEDFYGNPIIKNERQLRLFLKRVHHEDFPDLSQVTWCPRNERSVYISYKDDIQRVTSSVVEVLRKINAGKESK